VPPFADANGRYWRKADAEVAMVLRSFQPVVAGGGFRRMFWRDQGSQSPLKVSQTFQEWLF
jgi:hypothetical protein